MKDLAERIRSLLLEAAIQAYDDAGMRGLCAEGRWEAAVSALRSVDVKSCTEADQDGSGERLEGWRGTTSASSG